MHMYIESCNLFMFTQALRTFCHLFRQEKGGKKWEASFSKQVYFTSFMGCPQQTRVPAPDASTSTLFPHISQRYICPSSVTFTPPYILFSSFHTKPQSSFLHGHRLDISLELRCPRARDRSFCTST